MFKVTQIINDDFISLYPLPMEPSSWVWEITLMFFKGHFEPSNRTLPPGHPPCTKIDGPSPPGPKLSPLENVVGEGEEVLSLRSLSCAPGPKELPRTLGAQKQYLLLLSPLSNNISGAPPMFQAPGMYVRIRNDPSPPKSALSNQ